MEYTKFCQDNRIPRCYSDACIQNLKNLQFYALSFLKSPFSIQLYGDPGTGKTYFLMTLIRELLDGKNLPRHVLRYINALELDERMEEENRTGGGRYLIQALKEPHFLFIDDFGVEKSKERAERNYYSLLDDRLGNSKPTVISSNLKEEEVLGVYGARIHSRLKQCTTLHIKGEDQRTNLQTTEVTQ